MEKFFNIVCTVASMYIVFNGVVSLNRMSPATNDFVRTAFIVLTVGAVCNILVIWHPFNWRTQDLWGFEFYDALNMVWTVGVAVYVWANTRRKALLTGELNEAHSGTH